MRRQTFTLLLLIAVVFSSLAVAQEVKPKNVILFIADGTGHNQLKMTNYWKYGEAGQLSFQKFPVKLSMTHVPSTVPPYDPDHMWHDPYAFILGPTDSAASATAMATGQKAKNRTISVSPFGAPLQTAMERAAAVGKAVGVVTTSGFYDATPSAFLAHSETRYNTREIVTQMLFQSPARVIIGAGDPRYNGDGMYEEDTYLLRRIGGLGVWLDILKAATEGGSLAPQGFEPWMLIQKAEDFRALREGDTPLRVLGITHSNATQNATRSGHDGNIEDDLPYEVSRLTSVPTLTDMMLVAINVVDEAADGFFLLIENEGTDDSGHSWQAGRLIEEVLEFDTAIAAAVKWVEENSSWEETLIIVTADHETGFLTGPTVGRAWSEIQPVPAGTVAPHHWGTRGHSNLPVPFYAAGVGASGFYELADEKDPRFGNCLRNDELGRFLLRMFGASVDAVNLEE